MKASDADRQNKEIGEHLGKLRRSCGMTQVEAAKALGMTQSCLSQLESGKRRVSGAAVKQFAELYGADVSEIISVSRLPADRDIAPGRGTALLNELISGTGSEELRRSAEAYLALCEYRMLRAVYLLNPHNSRELFSLSDEQAEKLLEDFLREEPRRLEILDIKGREDIELPVEKAAELREFIASCEALLGSGT